MNINICISKEEVLYEMAVSGLHVIIISYYMKIMPLLFFFQIIPLYLILFFIYYRSSSDNISSRLSQHDTYVNFFVRN